MNDLKSALGSDDKEVIEKKTEILGQASAAIAQRAYASSHPGGGAGPGGGSPGAGGEAPAGADGAAGAGAQGKTDENVVDAEFEEVRDKGRRAS
jgi:molecular chaperone DnaK